MRDVSGQNNKSLTAAAEEKLEKTILSGGLKIGDQLPTERQLAEDMGVSKGIVHTAIAGLTRKGFLRVSPRHGVYVADYIRNGTLDVLNAIAGYSAENIDGALADSIVRTRFALEYIPVSALAENHTTEQMNRLDMLLQGMRSAAGGGAASNRPLAEKIQEFFLARCVMSGNLVIPIIVSASSEVSIVLTEKWLDAAGAEAALDGLERTMKLISAGRADAAVDSMRRNTASAADAIRKGK